jgi:endoribonuclease Dicer
LIGRSKLAASELGEWCADKFWALSLSEDNATRLQHKTEQLYAGDCISQIHLQEELNDIRDAKELVQKAMLDFKIVPRLETPDLSNKVLQLKECLDLEYDHPTEARTIVFVERRITAQLLFELFTKLATPHMRVGILIGARKSESGDVGFSLHQQLLAVSRFDTGEINVLFATSIAEEGLDIAGCNVIVRFDPFKTLIQFIQSRGRARHKLSKYVHIVEVNNADHLQTLQDVKRGELVLQQFYKALSPDRLLNSLDDDLDERLLKTGTYRTYTEDSTGAKITYGTALGQLNYFVATLPDSEETQLQADFIISYQNKKFICEVILPATSPIRCAVGEAYAQKSIAKRSAAYNMCVALRKNKYLDENLLPIYHKRHLPEMRNARLAINEKRTNTYDYRIKPKIWEESWGTRPTHLYLLLMRAEETDNSERPLAPFLLLTRKRLPELSSFPVYLKPGMRTDLRFRSYSTQLDVTEENLEGLTAFTLRVFKDPFNKTYENNILKMSYWLAPASQVANESKIDELIDWDIIKFVQRNDFIPWDINMPYENLEGRFLVDPYNGAYRYFTIHVDRCLKATDPPPEGSSRRRRNDTIVSWTSSLWKRSASQASFDPNQPVIISYQIPPRRNWLDDWDDKETGDKTKAYVCPEPLRISALPLAVAAMSFVFPALIWRIDSYLIAQEACKSLGLEVRLDLALEAITKDSNNTDEHKEQQIQFQRGMGKNYERLEFIGDAFLKMATSISLFAQNSRDDEFESHVKRMLMICNQNLFNHAVDMKVYEYIRSESFSRRTWYPEGLTLLEGKGAKKADANGENKYELQKHHLNKKTIADVCEALIGASLLSQKDSNRMDMAVKAVTTFVKDSNHDVQVWDDYYKLYKIPNYQVASATAAQLGVADQLFDRLGYRFEWPRLLSSAFTHPSWPTSWGDLPSYQRLELLGDSLLDMVCVNWLFYKYPDKDPQWLTEHKMAMVSNKFLGALCVKLKLHPFLKHNGSSSLMGQILNYVRNIQAAEAESDGAPDYWTTVSDPPKCLPDIVEAYMGAIFVDSRFSFSVVEDFFEKHIRWYFEDMTIYDTFANNHPTTYLTNLLQNTFHCTEGALMAGEIPSLDETTPRIGAVFMVHLQVVAGAESSSSKYAKIRASTRALDQLKGLSQQEFKQTYKCMCKEKEDCADDENNDAHEIDAPMQAVTDGIGSAI